MLYMCHVMLTLCYDLLCCKLHHSVWCCAELWCVLPCYVCYVLHYVMSWYVLSNVTICCALFCVGMCCCAMPYGVLYYVVLCCVTFRYVMLCMVYCVVIRHVV